MLKTFKHLGLLLVLLTLAAKAENSSLHINVKAFVNNYCIDCHNEKKDKGKVRLDNIEYSFNTPASIYLWQDILDVLNVGEMPPEDEKQPNAEELTFVLGNITEELKNAKKSLFSQGGKIPMRHLNRREYAATLESIFGMQIPLGSLPEDQLSQGFDTDGAKQYFSDQLLEQYFDIGHQVISSAVKWSLTDRKKTVTLTNELETGIRKRAQQKIDELKGKMAKLKSGKSWKEAGFDSEGTYKLFMSRYERHLEMNQRIIDAPECKTGVYFDRAAVKHLGHNVRPDPRAWYKFRLIGGKNSPPSHLSRFLDLIINDEKSGSMYVYGTVKDPQLSEITFRGNIFSSRSSVKIMNNNRTIGLSKDYPWEDNIWIDKLEIVGPYYDSKETPFEKILSGFLKNDSPSDEEVLQVLEKFSTLVFRNASNKQEYLNGLHNLYKKNLQDGLKSKDAIIDPLAVIISSPAFLYFHEKNKEDSSYIDEVSFANRLSYFLWSAPADNELLKLAKEGKIRDAAVVKQQIDRMLKSPKSEKFYRGFVEQWFDLKRFDSTTVDENKYPHYSFSVQESARKEPVAFIKEVIKSNLPISNYISSDFVVIDDVLASHYGIAKKHSPGFTKINLAENSIRGGLLTQTAFLVMGSTGERTSPVIRGTLVRDIFLNDPPPQPPPNVPELAFKEGEVKSIKQITKEHQSIPQCASCHRKIDPIGFGLENFNTVGLWREHEEPNTKAKGRKGRNAKGKKSKSKNKKDIGAKVDPSGQLASGQSFNNFDEFKNVLLSKTDDLALSFYHGLLSYGIGRPISFVDEKEIDESLQSLKAKNYRLKDMILEVVTSRTFNSKK